MLLTEAEVNALARQPGDGRRYQPCTPVHKRSKTPLARVDETPREYEPYDVFTSTPCAAAIPLPLSADAQTAPGAAGDTKGNGNGSRRGLRLTMRKSLDSLSSLFQNTAETGGTARMLVPSKSRVYDYGVLEVERMVDSPNSDLSPFVWLDKASRRQSIGMGPEALSCPDSPSPLALGIVSVAHTTAPVLVEMSEPATPTPKRPEEKSIQSRQSGHSLSLSPDTPTPKLTCDLSRSDKSSTPPSNATLPFQLSPLRLRGKEKQGDEMVDHGEGGDAERWSAALRHSLERL